MPSYSEWNKILYESLFPKSDSDRPVYYLVDEEIIELCCAEKQVVESAVDDFRRAVCKQVGCENGIDLNRVKGGSNDEIPAQTAFLGFCILAASAMERQIEGERDISSSNFYYRLNEQLGSEGSGRPNGLNNVELERLWLNFARRLKDAGRGILHLTQGASTRRYVWYPISQVLLNREDRNKLRSFFKTKNFPVFLDDWVTVENFQGELISWAQTSNLSKRVKIDLATADLRQQEIVSQARKELSRWDGSDYKKLSTKRIFRTARAELMIERGEFSGWNQLLVLKRRDTWPMNLEISDSRGLSFSVDVQDETSDFYTPVQVGDDFSLGCEIDFKTLANGIERRIYRPESSVVAFYHDSRFYGALLSTERIHVNESIFVASRVESVAKTADFLAEACDLPKAKVFAHRTSFLPGWTLFKEITVKKHVDTTDKDLACLCASMKKKVNFREGLPVIGERNHNVYLIPGFPKVEFVGNWNKEETVLLDGEECGLREVNTKISKLSEGNHVINFGSNQYRRFELRYPRMTIPSNLRFVERLGSKIREIEGPASGVHHSSISGPVVQGQLIDQLVTYVESPTHSTDKISRRSMEHHNRLTSRFFTRVSETKKKVLQSGF